MLYVNDFERLCFDYGCIYYVVSLYIFLFFIPSVPLFNSFSCHSFHSSLHNLLSLSSVFPPLSFSLIHSLFCIIHSPHLPSLLSFTPSLFLRLPCNPCVGVWVRCGCGCGVVGRPQFTQGEVERVWVAGWLRDRGLGEGQAVSE